MSNIIEDPNKHIAPVLVGGPGQSPMVNLGVRVVNHKEVLTINCAACGDNVQHTGEGGYTDVNEAKSVLMQHRINHINALVEEALSD